MSTKRAKEAYLRKHGLGRRTSKEDLNYSSTGGYSSTEEDKPSSTSVPGSPTKKSSEQSWAQKRKDSVLARATGERTPRAAVETPSEQLGVALKASIFTAKLKESVRKTKGEEAPLSWSQKRAEAFKRTHGVPKAPIEELKVSTTAILFAAKLKRLAGAAAAGATPGGGGTGGMGGGTGGMGGGAGGVVLTVGDGPVQPELARAAEARAAEVQNSVRTRRESREEAKGEQLSWTQRRKEAYLRKYGKKGEEPMQPDVAVSAITFAAKLKARKAASDAAAASSAPVELS